VNVVVSNSGPLINLARIGRLDLLPSLYTTLMIPSAVYREVVVRGSGQPGSDEVAQAGWITTRSVTDTLAVAGLATMLDQGEAEAIVLAKELSAAELLIDERLGRRMAQSLGLPIKGTLGILVRAKHRGLVPNVKDDLDSLLQHGMWISARVYNATLQAAGEAQTP
jgi:hypothetical protein